MPELIYLQLPAPDYEKILKEDLAGYEKYEKKEVHEHVIANYLRAVLKIEKKN